jgi:UDPglucose 6-dehydrogenase
MSVVAFLGMTHLGLNHAAAAAQLGFDVLCLDSSSTLIGELVDGRLTVSEPGLAEAFDQNAERIRFSSSLDELASVDLVYISPDVPTDDVGGSDLSQVREFVEAVSTHAAPGCAVVILSQVPPGFTRVVARQHHEHGGQILWFYQVETLIFGQAFKRALEPERFIVGSVTPEASLPPAMEEFLQSFECPILMMRYESAELAKIAINCMLAASVSTTNALAELCETIGADWDEIAPALRLDRRIGPYAYLNPGLGISGGNLERDLATICRMAGQQGADDSVIASYRHNSEYRKDWVLRQLHQEGMVAGEGVVIGMLGLAYKQDTDSTKNSPAIRLLRDLPQVRVLAYDPAVEDTEPFWHPNLTRVNTALDVCKGADVVVMMTPWPEFQDLVVSDIASAMRGHTVLDPFRLLDPGACAAAGLRWLALGAGPMPINY